MERKKRCEELGFVVSFLIAMQENAVHSLTRAAIKARTENSNSCQKKNRIYARTIIMQDSCTNEGVHLSICGKFEAITK